MTRTAILLCLLVATLPARPVVPAWDRVELEVHLDGCDRAVRECAWIRLAYPRFVSDGDDRAPGALNARVEELLLPSVLTEIRHGTPHDLARDFLAEYRETRDDDLATPAGWWLERELEVAWTGAEALSLRMEESSYVGGAHPNSVVLWLVLDHGGRKVDLSEVVRADRLDEFQALGERAFRAYHGLPPGERLDELGFWFEGGRFSLNDNWGVLDAGLVFHFNPYEVAAYALGATEIILPWKDAEPLLRPGFPLAEAASAAS